MNDARFKELLNLYLDHELTPEQTSELEAEILQNPVRRRVYRDYCRLQRGCGQLFDQTLQSAPASFALAQALRDAERKVEGGGSGERGVWWGYGGAAAVAACVALVVFRGDGPGLGTPTMQAEADQSQPVVAATAPPRGEDFAGVSIATIGNGLSASAATGERETGVGSSRPMAVTPTLVLATLGGSVSFDEVQRQRASAQRWFEEDALAQAQRASTAEERYFDHRHLSPDVHSFNSRAVSMSGGRAELTSYQFQR